MVRAGPQAPTYTGDSASVAEVRIAVIGQGDGSDPATWSGIPRALGGAFTEAGHDVAHIDANPPIALRRALVGALRLRGIAGVAAHHGPEFAAARTRWVRRELGRSAADLVVQINTGFTLPPGTRYVTLSDLTAAQGTDVGWSDPALAGRRAAAAWRSRERGIFHAAARCCAASDWSAASVVRDYGVPDDRVVTTGFGFTARARPGRRSWRDPRFLFIGREWERKNGPSVVRAFARVRTLVPSATLTLVGTHPRVREPGVVDVGVLAPGREGDRLRLVALLEGSTCFVMPSLLEPFGIAYLEAGAAGIASIGTIAGGAATAVGPSGILVDPDDDDALTAAMLRMADPDMARGAGEAAAAHAAAYTWTGVAQRVLDAAGPTTEALQFRPGPIT